MALTPMMQQYFDAKKNFSDAVVLFRLGDFFEMFYDDAKICSEELGLTLTHRQNAPMCGFPCVQLDTYTQRLVTNGHKVAVVDQVSDPKEKGLTDRAVTKVVTPGTILTEDVLDQVNNNFLVIIVEDANEIALAGADVSTGECFYDLYSGSNMEQALFDEIYRLNASEILIAGEVSFKKKLDEFINLRLKNCTVNHVEPLNEEQVTARLNEQFDDQYIPVSTLAAAAVAGIVDYLNHTVMTDIKHMSTITRLDVSDHLQLDAIALKNLEVTRNIRDGSKKNTLFDVLDLTKTPMGTRLLRKWLETPLVNIKSINRRLDAVDELVKNFSMRSEVRKILKDIRDIERLMMKVETGSANAIDLNALKSSLSVVPSIADIMNDVKTDILIACRDGLGNYNELTDLLNRALVESPSVSLRDGGLIKPGYSADLDEYKQIASDSKSMLQAMEEKERETTGIKTLKIGYNRVFGYYIEIKKSGAGKVPAHYVRKQTLTNGERYITEELRIFEEKILGAQEKIVAIEYNLFVELRNIVKDHLKQIQNTARRIALIDVVAALAKVAADNNYVRPDLQANGNIEIKDGRHPLVERIMKGDLFVPNDTDLNHATCETMIITGPNMAGKSTYMRQVALITLMAQAGSFVPARSATISPVDRIFTRVGASDDLVSGQSTFMVEMNEVAHILKYATRNSLIVLDEVGRGTSTFDGMSIAHAVVEYIDKKIHAKTLFATHYHELTTLADKSDRIKNFCVAVRERGSEIIFLRRIKAGGADRSYGIQVAKLAGLPRAVMSRAEEFLAELESAPKIISSDATNKPASKSVDHVSESLFTSSLTDELLKVDVTTLTPIEALNVLYRLQNLARNELGLKG